MTRQEHVDATVSINNENQENLVGDYVVETSTSDQTSTPSTSYQSFTGDSNDSKSMQRTPIWYVKDNDLSNNIPAFLGNVNYNLSEPIHGETPFYFFFQTFSPMRSLI